MVITTMLILGAISALIALHLEEEITITMPVEVYLVEEITKGTREEAECLEAPITMRRVTTKVRLEEEEVLARTTTTKEGAHSGSQIIIPAEPLATTTKITTHLEAEAVVAMPSGVVLDLPGITKHPLPIIPLLRAPLNPKQAPEVDAFSRPNGRSSRIEQFFLNKIYDIRIYESVFR